MQVRAETIGPYRLLEPLGSGGMGVVYRAEHLRSLKRVALKTVRVPREGMLSGLRREIHALARIEHPQVVRILEEGVEAGLPWYAMELLEGTTLRRLAATWAGSEETQILTSTEAPQPSAAAEDAPLSSLRWWTTALASVPEPMPARPPRNLPKAKRPRALPGSADGWLSEVLSLVRGLCAPLAFLHGEGIVHRDLKPENILVLPDGLPVLIDFGLVSRAGGPLSREVLEIEGGTAGTVAYMAPEHGRGHLVDARADLYALGCILYELLTGRPPFLGASPAQVLYQHFESPPLPPSQLAEGVETELDALVLRLLAKKPKDRFGHADAVAEALGRLGAREMSAPGAPRPRAYLYRPGFAGREETVQQLSGLCAGLESGSGGLVLVGGESGVGKTRLALELARQSEGRKLRVLTGECASGGAALHPLLPALKSIADRCRERGEKETERLLGRRGKVLALYEPALARLPGQEEAQDVAPLPAEAARLRLFSYLAETLAALAGTDTLAGADTLAGTDTLAEASTQPSGSKAQQGAPLLLILDDLQWADDLTLGFLGFLLQAGHLGRTPLLVLGTYRSEDVRATHESPLRRLIEAPGSVGFVLGRLEEQAVGAMIGEMLALAPAPRLFARFLARQSEGNPFFVGEYLRTAVAEGLLYRDELGRWHVAHEGDEETTEMAYEELPLPTSLRQLVARRLAGLSAGAGRLVEAAAVAGRESESVLVWRMTGLELPELLEATAEALRRQVLEEADTGRLRFAHDKLREVAYERLPQEGRDLLHGAAARGIEALFAPEQDQHLAALAHHWEQAGDPDKAKGYALAGARKSAARHAHGEAEGLYRSYLGLTPRPTAESVAARNELARDVLVRRGRNEEARLEHRRALEDSRLLGDRKGEALSLRGLAEIHRWTGHLEEAIGLLEQALELFRQLGDRDAEGQSLGSLGSVLQEQGRYEQAASFCEQARAIFREVGNAQQEGHVLNVLGSISLERGLVEGSIELYEKALANHKRTGERVWEGFALGNLGLAHQQLGRLQQASELMEESLEISREVGLRRQEGNVLNSLGALRQAQGRLEASQTCMEQALQIFREIGDRRIEAVVLNNLADLQRRQGNAQKAEGLCQQALVLIRGVGNRRFEGWTLGLLALCQADQGRIETARERFAEALEALRECGDRFLEAGALTGLAVLERRSGSPLARGERLNREAEAIFKDFGNTLSVVDCLCERGHLAIARGRPGSRLLEQARRIAADAQAGLESPLGQTISRLERAADALRTGRRLFRGECVEDLPEGLRLRLAEDGQLEPR